MNSTLFIKTNKWYQVILVWELYRIPYNLLMVITGLIGFQFLYANIPALYIAIGLVFNLGYTGLSVIDLVVKKKAGKNYSRAIFLSYLVFSSAIVIGLPAGALFRMWLKA